MEHLQVDPSAVIIDPVKEPAPPVPVDSRTGRLVLPLHHGTDIAAVQIVPEQPLAQDTRKMRKIWNGSVQCLLQQGAVDLLFQFTGDPEDTRIGSLRCRWNNLRVIVQFIPFRPCHVLCLSIPTRWDLRPLLRTLIICRFSGLGVVKSAPSMSSPDHLPLFRFGV